MPQNRKILNGVFISVTISLLATAVGWFFRSKFVPFFRSLFGRVSVPIDGRGFNNSGRENTYYIERGIDMEGLPNSFYTSLDSPDFVGSGRLVSMGGRMQDEFILSLLSAYNLCTNTYSFAPFPVFDPAHPLRLTSGFRTEAYNRTLKKASPNSNHLRGLAVDISGFPLDGELLTRAVSCFAKCGLSCRAYDWGTHYHLHVDKRSTPSMSYDSSFKNTKLITFCNATFKAAYSSPFVV
jgi:Peptidase M15